MHIVTFVCVGMGIIVYIHICNYLSYLSACACLAGCLRAVEHKCWLVFLCILTPRYLQNVL